MITIFKEVMGENKMFRVEVSETRNWNRLIIHDNNLGCRKAEYTMWDSDVVKAVRILSELVFSYDSYDEIMEKLEKGTRHLQLKEL